MEQCGVWYRYTNYCVEGRRGTIWFDCPHSPQCDLFLKAAVAAWMVDTALVLVTSRTPCEEENPRCETLRWSGENSTLRQHALSFRARPHRGVKGVLCPPRRLEPFPFIQFKQPFGPVGSGANSVLPMCGVHEAQRYIPGHRSRGGGT